MENGNENCRPMSNSGPYLPIKKLTKLASLQRQGVTSALKELLCRPVIKSLNSVPPMEIYISTQSP